MRLHNNFVLNFAGEWISFGVKKHFFSLQLLDVQQHCSVESHCTVQQNIPHEMMNTWEQVRILIIDKVSFSPEDQMDKLNACLNHV